MLPDAVAIAKAKHLNECQDVATVDTWRGKHHWRCINAESVAEAQSLWLPKNHYNCAGVTTGIKASL